jgi:hypothetical protein
MSWNGRATALQLGTIEAFRSYLNSLNFSGWKPSGMTLHNTASPNLQQWWHSGTPPAQRMKNLKSYYQGLGWSAGPHAFVDGVSIWVMTDFNVKGVHSPSWNGTRLGIEMVGDYDKESDESGEGLRVMNLTVALFGECMNFFGWEPTNERIKLHKEDPRTTHDCPGKNVIKSEFLNDVNNYMGEGGDHVPEPTPVPEEPREGVVYNLPAKDRLNIRSAASSSSDVIGSADQGDVLTIVGSSMNGNTRWLRVQFGEQEGPYVEVFGWVVSKYVKIEGEIEEKWRTDVTATVFGVGSDAQDGAYDNYIDGRTRGVSLPYKWRGVGLADLPFLTVRGPRGEVDVQIVDVGPWNINDPGYVNDGMRPLAERQFEQKTLAQNGQIPTNDAGIDLTGPIAAELGISGKGKVSWKFKKTPGV